MASIALTDVTKGVKPVKETGLRDYLKLFPIKTIHFIYCHNATTLSELPFNLYKHVLKMNAVN